MSSLRLRKRFSSTGNIKKLNSVFPTFFFETFIRKTGENKTSALETELVDAYFQTDTVCFIRKITKTSQFRRNW